MLKHTVEQVKLNSGAEGLLIHVPDASVMSFELNFRAGEFLVPKSKWEVPHLMEHTILGANKTYPAARQFISELQKNGAYTNAFTSYYSVSYLGEVADIEWERVLELQLLALSQPLFLQKEFKAEWGNIRDELTSYCNNHFRHLGSELARAFGFNSVTDFERIELMKNVHRADIIAHYKATHLSKNMRFIIAGNLHARKSRITKLLEEVGINKGKERFALPAETASKPKKPVFITNDTVKNIYLYVNLFTNKAITNAQDDALSLVRIMFTETLHSRIFGIARERGLVYSVNSGHFRGTSYTEWWLSAQVLPNNAAALCEIIKLEIQKVLDGKIVEQDIEAAKQYALGSFQRSLQTVGSIAGAYGRYFLDEYIEDIDSIPDRIKKITSADMRDALKAIFDEKIGGVGVLGGSDPEIAKQLNNQVKSLWR